MIFYLFLVNRRLANEAGKLTKYAVVERPDIMDAPVVIVEIMLEPTYVTPLKANEPVVIPADTKVDPDATKASAALSISKKSKLEKFKLKLNANILNKIRIKKFIIIKKIMNNLKLCLILSVFYKHMNEI